MKYKAYLSRVNYGQLRLTRFNYEQLRLTTDLKINMEYFSGNAFTYTQTQKLKNGYSVK